MNGSLEIALAQRAQELDRLRGWLIGKLRLKREISEIDPDVPLFGTGLGLDSIDAMELMVGLKTEYRIGAEEESVRRSLRTVNTLLDFILAESAQQALKEEPHGTRD